MDNHIGGDAIRRRIDTDAVTPSVQVAKIVAELENADPTDLAAMYDSVDDVLENVFSDPPSADARMAVRFSYEGYHITVFQDGDVTLVPEG